MKICIEKLNILTARYGQTHGQELCRAANGKLFHADVNDSENILPTLILIGLSYRIKGMMVLPVGIIGKLLASDKYQCLSMLFGTIDVLAVLSITNLKGKYV
jgi:hypothetical protein